MDITPDMIGGNEPQSSVEPTPSPEPVAPVTQESGAETTQVETPETPSTEVSSEQSPTSTHDTPQSQAEEGLYDLPDGRKVDAATLAKEFKENFLPDYTRKSQKIAEFEKTTNINKLDESVPYFLKPDWEPSNYQEVLQAAEDRLLYKQQQQLQAEEQKNQYVGQLVDSQIQEVKKLDKDANVDRVFAHALKLKTNDLVAAYHNMKEIDEIRKQTQAETLKNLKEREGQQVGTTTSQTSDDGVDYGEVSQGGDIYDKVREHYHRLKG